MRLIIATRESPLALWQANWVKTQLEAIHPGMMIELLGITTQADTLLDIPLAKVGGKGLFVKELEQALLDGKAHIAVHSMKDVPMELPTGLILPVMCQREDPRDAFVSNDYQSLLDVPTDSVIGTSSLRRQCQIHALRPDLKMDYLRGNINTRIAKLDRGDYAGIILASAGLNRMGLACRVRQYFDFSDSLPAAGQGVLGIECRENDKETQALIGSLNHLESAACVKAERVMCRTLDGGCHMPVAAFAEIKENQLFLRGLVGMPDGSLILRASACGSIHDSEQIGKKVASDLLAEGAEDILNCIQL